MSNATLIALGASAIGLLVVAGCLALAISVNKKKAANPATPDSKPEA